ncbi:MAG: GlsB/YeaQ/YmgE family stress response membrane protein [Anaerolineae bacterium]|nr:GlsB/YeaQ/YmgE family stress response membrane protein [Anaerolineae bacterium]
MESRRLCRGSRLRGPGVAGGEQPHPSPICDLTPSIQDKVNFSGLDLGSILVAFIGAVILLAILRMIQRR